MKHLSNALNDHLKSGTTTLAYCWIIRRKDGEVLGFTDHDRSLNLDGVGCEPSSGFTASQSRESADFSIDDQDIQGALSSDWLSEEDLMDGLYDEAVIETWRVNWTNVNEKFLLRSGYLGEISRSDQHFSAQIKSITAKMDQVQGRLYQSGCDATLGDRACQVDLTDPQWSRRARITRIESTSRLKFDLLTGESEVESDFFSHGQFEVLDEQLKGRIINILMHDQSDSSGSIDVWGPLPSTLQVGHEVRLIAGCNRRFETCRTKFSNQLNFRGFPHLPGNDFLLGYPGLGNLNDGSALHANEDTQS